MKIYTQQVRCIIASVAVTLKPTLSYEPYVERKIRRAGQYKNYLLCISNKKINKMKKHFTTKAKMVLLTCFLCVSSFSLFAMGCIVVINGKTYVIPNLTCADLSANHFSFSICAGYDKTQKDKNIKIVRTSTNVILINSDGTRFTLASDQAQKEMAALIQAKNTKAVNAFKDKGGAISDATVNSLAKDLGATVEKSTQ